MKTIGNDLGNDIIDTVTKGDGTKAFERVGVIRFRDECNKCGVEGFIYLPNDYAISNYIQYVLSKKFQKHDVELN